MANRGALAAEFLGAFALTFVGAAAILNDMGLLVIALAHGLILAVMISATGHISGAHFNPAVSIAMWATGRLPASSTIAYIAAQCAGAVVAALLLISAYPAAVWTAAQLGTPAAAAGVGAAQAVLVEVVLTFFLVFVIFGTAVDERGPNHLAGFAIGLTVAADILAGGPVTGAAMNPARALGPALVGGFWTLHWVYWVGPVIGGLLAAFTYDRFVGRLRG